MKIIRGKERIEVVGYRSVGGIKVPIERRVRDVMAVEEEVVEVRTICDIQKVEEEKKESAVAEEAGRKAERADNSVDDMWEGLLENKAYYGEKKEEAIKIEAPKQEEAKEEVSVAPAEIPRKKRRGGGRSRKKQAKGEEQAEVRAVGGEEGFAQKSDIPAEEAKAELEPAQEK